MWTFALLSFPVLCSSGTQDYVVEEYQVKLAYLVNFISYSEWPASSSAPTDIFTIGIAGDPSFAALFKPIENKKVRGKKLRILQIQDGSETDQLMQCSIVFISSRIAHQEKEIITSLANKPILTAGESKDFLKNGGMVNFILHNENIRFSLNRNAARKAGVRFRSGLLRLAVTILDNNENGI